MAEPSSWKRDFARGLIVLVPLLVVLALVNWLYTQIADLPIVDSYPKYGVLIALVVFILVTLSVGYLMRTTLGGFFEEGLDTVMNQLPGVRVIYNASKMAVETAVTGTDLQKPVKLETWNGLRMTAFKTGKQTADGRELLFIPTSPNITTGFVVEVEQSRFVETDESVEDALTRVLSAGFGENRRDGIPIAVDEEDITGPVTTDTDD